MPQRRKLPDVGVLIGLFESGTTIEQIAERYGVTAEAVRLKFRQAGYEYAHQRASHAQYLPWTLNAAHSADTIARRLRAYSKSKQGRTLSATERRLLDEFLAYMDGDNPWGVKLSVHYRATDADGFWLEARKPGDRDYIHPPAA